MSKIDVHNHHIPPPYAKAVEDAGGDPSGWPMPHWSPEACTEIMKAVGDRTAILSVTAPGPEISPTFEGQRSLAREINAYSAKLRDSQPQTFGFFASLPSLFDVEGAIAEIRYALGELHADGVVLFSRYGDGPFYLGHEEFKPVWAELSAHKAVVFMHPTHPADVRLANSALPNPVIDYPHETMRTAMDLILSNRKRENPECKIILSHAGGTLPFLVHRAAELIPSSLPPSFLAHPMSPEKIVEDAKSFYVDTALSTSKIPFTATLEFFGADHILFGTDFPYAKPAVVITFSKLLDEFGLEEEAEKTIFFRNGEKFFPRLKSGH